MALMRVNGTVLRTDRREGVAKASGNAYRFDVVTVLVCESGTAEVTVRPESNLIVARGEYVDWLVDAEAFGASLRVGYVEPTPAQYLPPAAKG